MLIDAFIRVLLLVVEPLVGALPTGSLEGVLPDAEVLGSYLNRWDFFVPVKGPLGVLIAWVGALSAYLALRAAVWAWNLLPFT